MKGKTKEKHAGPMLRLIRGVERIGNKLPHPMYIFLYLLVLCMVISAICAAFGVSVEYTSMTDGVVEEKTADIVNLFSERELQNFLANIVNAFKANSVLIPMLICTFCITTVDDTGFFSVAFRRMLRGSSQKIATFVLCFVCVCANIASDAGAILAISFGAILFKALGRNPWIGITLAYGCVQAGYSANILPSTVDALYAGITGPLAEPYGYVVHPMSNYLFMFVATFLLALAFTYVGEKYLVAIFGDTERNRLKDEAVLRQSFTLTEDEKRGLHYAGIGAAVYAVLLVLGLLPDFGIPYVTGFLRNPDTGELFPSSPFLSGLIPLIGLLFLFIGLPFGFGSGYLKSKADIPPLLQKGVTKMSSLILILFPCSLFIYQFNRSNLSILVSSLGEDFLTSIHLTGFPMFLVFIIVVGIINVFMYSSSAKWMILAPIFVPMFTNMGVDPAYTQLAARIGDSCTNGLSPLNAALVAVLALMEQYQDKTLNPQKPGLGSVLSAQIPLAAASFVTLTILFAVFYFAGWPIGIGS